MTVRATGLVLAGGQSRRMGTRKALLRFEGETLIARVHGVLASLCDPILVVANDASVAAELPAAVIADAAPGGSVVHGLLAGLRASPHELAIAVACDMPYLASALLKHQLERAIDYDAVVIAGPTGVEPLHGVYRKTILPLLERLAERPSSALRDLLGDAKTLVLEEAEVVRYDPERRSAVNLNTPEDVAHWGRAAANSRR